MADMSAFDRIPSFGDGDARRAADDLRERAERSATARREILDVVGEAESDDGLVRAVAGLRGLEGLTLEPKAMRIPSQDLARTIVDVAQRAAEQLERNRAERARELGVDQARADLGESLAQLDRLRGLMAEGDGDMRRVFERFRDQTGR